MSEMKQELLSMQEVIEMRTEEVRKLKKELDRREGRNYNHCRQRKESKPTRISCLH